MTGPLQDVRVVVTRAAQEASGLAGRLESLGAIVLLAPVIQFAPAPDPARLQRALAEAPSFDWVLFTSPRGVDVAWPGAAGWPASRPRIAAVGPTTAARLSHRGLRCDFVPSRFTGADLARELPAGHGASVLLVRAEVAEADLPRILRDRGVRVEEVAAYATRPAPPSWLPRLLQGPTPDWILFTSASTAAGLARCMDTTALGRVQAQVRAAAIGPVTARAARAAGFRVAAEARVHTEDGLVAALLEAHVHA